MVAAIASLKKRHRGQDFILYSNGDPITDTKCGNSITKPRVNLAVTIDAVGNEVPLDEALDNTSLPWKTAGDAEWFGQTTVSCHDGDAAKSGSISDNQSSSIETIVTGPGSLSFYWKVSSEKNYDFFTFIIDGISYSQMSGEVPCHKVTYEIAPGDHTLMWSQQFPIGARMPYVKIGSSLLLTHGI